jgi:hypothetical protein
MALQKSTGKKLNRKIDPTLTNNVVPKNKSTNGEK